MRVYVCVCVCVCVGGGGGGKYVGFNEAVLNDQFLIYMGSLIKFSRELKPLFSKPALVHQKNRSLPICCSVDVFLCVCNW